MTDRIMSPLQHEEGLINPSCHAQDARASRESFNALKKVMVRPRGLEPPRVSPLAPQASASTNSAMAA